MSTPLRVLSMGTYELRRKMGPWLGEHGLKVVTVTGKRTDVVREDWSDSVLIPAFAFAREGDKDAGQVRRQCTHDWKIMPIREFVRGGCRGMTKRRGRDWRMCAQSDIGGGYCWYHDPERPHRFGEGYRYEVEDKVTR